ncbi:MAG TPA: sugar ABC transporter permease [Candidatus Binataceae bacterium]|nr:sugar ABC transporter permease [Candidatus Binataceae bacterium]
MNRQARRLRAVFVAAPALFMLTTLVVPALGGLAASFDRGGPSFGNYAALARDPMFWRATLDNLLLPIASLALELAAGLAMALMITARAKGPAIVQVAAILPFAIPEIVVLTIARYLLMPRGYLNGALIEFGMPPAQWLAPHGSLAMLSVVVVDAWHVTPIVMLMLAAGLQTIPPELYEAARLDGADRLATFWYVTLPLLAPAIVGAAILRGIDALRIFSTVLVLTGPEAVPVLSTYAYGQWTDAQAPRVAMAAAMVLALIVTLFALGGALAVRRWSSDPGAPA